MPTFWSKLKTFLCCGEEEDPPIVIVSYTLLLTLASLTDALVRQGEPFDFKRVEVELAGLSEHESVLPFALSTMKTYLLTSDALDAL